ncbi:MAG: hypothetical protein ACI8XV_002533, partial [Arenicella sp.]
QHPDCHDSQCDHYFDKGEALLRLLPMVMVKRIERRVNH